MEVQQRTSTGCHPILVPSDFNAIRFWCHLILMPSDFNAIRFWCHQILILMPSDFGVIRVGCHKCRVSYPEGCHQRKGAILLVQYLHWCTPGNGDLVTH